MNQNEIREVAWVGDAYVRQPIRALILSFHGLGAGIKGDPTTEQLTWARAGGLVVHPYCGPWSWMNRQTRTFVDDLIDDVRRSFAVPADAPLISTGGSMGGQGSLIFTRYTRHRVARCLAARAVCDLVYARTERPDVPATVAFAFRGYDGDRDSIIKEHSPLHQVEHLPKIPYMLVHGEKDESVSKKMHSDRMVPAMRARGLDVEYLEVEGMGHGGPMWIEVLQQQIDFVQLGFAR